MSCLNVCVMARWSVLQNVFDRSCVAVPAPWRVGLGMRFVLQCAAVCCSALQCAAVRYLVESDLSVCANSYQRGLSGHTQLRSIFEAKTGVCASMHSQQ